MNDASIDPAELLDLMERWSRLLIRPPARARQQLDAARRAFERGHLVVAGREGSGKSTLINAMLQADVAPTSRHEAGTVAPVYFLHAARNSPGYRVVHQSGGESQTREVSREEFEQWLLQRCNPDNERGVLRGEVTLNHPLLKEGLQLVDMPGTGGMSATVAAETREHLAGSAFSAILVNQGDRMAALAGVCDELRANQPDVGIVAIVVNEHDQDNVASDTDTNLEMLRQAFRKTLLPRLPPGALGFRESDIYALHLRSLANGKHISPEHDRQWEAFLRAVTGHVRDRGLSVTFRACREALQTLDRALAARSVLLEDLRVGRIPRSDLAALVAQAKGAARQDLETLKRREVATRPEHWPKVAAAAERQRPRLTELLDKHERAVSSELNLTHEQGKRIEENLTEALTTAAAEIDKAAAGDLDAELSQVCSDVLTAYAAALPVPTPPPPPEIAGPAAMTAPGRYSFMGLFGKFDMLIKLAGPLGPIIAAYPGIIAIPLQHYSGGGNRGEVLRKISHLRSQIQENLNTNTDESLLYQRWCEARQEAVSTCIETMEVRLEEIGNEVIEPTDLGKLERREREIDEARKSLEKWMNALS